MQLLHVLALTLPIFALAAPRPQVTSYDASSSLSTSYSSTTTVTKSATLTVTQTAPSSAATNSTSTSSSYQSQPTAPYIVTAARSGSPIHLLPMNAAGFRFYLGGQTATYCPSFVSEGDPNACGPGDVTALLGTCNMDAEVPGGQQIWATPDGTIGYTQAHSTLTPTDSIPCPFTWSKSDDSPFGLLSTSVFGATGLMACPMNATQGGGWQVFAAVPNSTFPTNGNMSCLGFDGLTTDFTGSIAAWQYI